jgi:type VI protein secretion system component VasA
MDAELKELEAEKRLALFKLRLSLFAVGSPLAELSLDDLDCWLKNHQDEITAAINKVGEAFNQLINDMKQNGIIFN